MQPEILKWFCNHFNQTGLWYTFHIQKCNHYYKMRWWSLFVLTEESIALGLHIVQVNNEKIHEALNKIDDGTKVKCLFGEADFSSEKQKEKRNQENCLKSQILCNFRKLSSELVSHLQRQLLSDKSFWKRDQYIHPKKRLVPGSTSAVSYIAVNIGRVMKNCLQSAFFPFGNCWRFMCLNMHSMVSLPNQINSTRLVQKLFRREGTIIFGNTTFALGICT